MIVLSNRISELRSVGHQLTDEQQVQSVICSILNAWEHLRINLTQNDNIKTFDDVAQHVELEEDHLLAYKPVGQGYMTKSKKFGASRTGRKKWKGKGFKPRKGGNKTILSRNKRKHRKRTRRHKKNMNCFNCGKPGHFARDWIETKVKYDQIHFYDVFVSSCLMLTETIPFWTLDSTTTDHIARDRNAYVDFCRILKGSRSIYMGNNTLAYVLGISTCKLIMRKGRTLYLHDVPYVPEVRRNLVYVVVLVKLGFKIVFEQDCVKVLSDNVVYGYGILSEGFIVLDIIPINKITYVFVIGNSSGNSVVNDIK